MPWVGTVALLYGFLVYVCIFFEAIVAGYSVMQRTLGGADRARRRAAGPMSAPFDAQAMDERQEFDGNYMDRDYTDEEIRQAWDLVAREPGYKHEDDGPVYFFNKITKWATEKTPSGCKRLDFVVLGDYDCGAYETAASLSDGTSYLLGDNHAAKRGVYVCRPGETFVVLHPHVGPAEREWDDDIRASMAFIVCFGATDSFAERDESVARALATKALVSSSFKVPVLLVPSSPRRPEMSEKALAAARLYAQNQVELDRPVECVEALSSGSFADESAAALATLVEKIAALQASGKRCAIQ